MKRVLFIIILYAGLLNLQAQEVLRVKNGATITVQNGVEVTTQGGITLENGSLLINNGTTRLKNNRLANQSNWTDNSILGALGGTGLVIFNSDQLQQFYGTTHFYNLQMNGAGLILNNNLSSENSLHLVNGKINTNSFYAFLSNNNSSSLINDAGNSGYTNSWINGNFRRAVTTNTSSYDFPVGNNTRSNLLQFLNNNISGPNYLTASFGPKPGTDAGLNVSENGVAYTGVNSGGVWYFSPDVSPTGGNYSLQLYFSGFTGLSDNLFGSLRRANSSTNAADWTVPSGSSLEAINGLGRKLSDGFSRRINISDFSQWGIGMMGSLPCSDCPNACTYSQGFYGNVNGTACYDNGGSVSSYQLMLNAFGNTTSKVFGSVANFRFFTLYKSDITSKNIYKMLPGSGNSQAIAVDNVSPYNGAFYSDPSTWYLVPIQLNGSQKGRINNLLLAQTITLWFNLQTSSTLASIDLSMDTLVTTAQTSCGSGILYGEPVKFGLPHSVVTYLDGGNGYSADVNGLFQLANDVLGGVVTNVNASDVQNAVGTINNAFDGCRVLTGMIPYSQPLLFTTMRKEKQPTSQTERLVVTAYPNPYYKDFSLDVISPVTGMATIEFFTSNGERIHQQRNYLNANKHMLIPYKGQRQAGSLLYTIRIDRYTASGIVVGIN